MTPTLRTMVLLLAGVGLIALPAVTVAVPLAYDEVLDGDLPDDPGNLTLNLDLGANTVAGTMANSLGAFGDFDEFSITLPVGGVLTSVSFAFVLSINGLVLPNTGFTLDGGAQTNLLLLSAVSPVAMFEAILPIEGGPFEIAQTGLACGCGVGEGWSASYTWTFDVQASVPEPGLAWMMGAGLIGVIMTRRRKHSMS